MKNPLIVLSFSLILAGCASEYDQCVQKVSAELRSIQSGINEAGGNLSRGYAIHRTIVPYTTVGICYTGTISYSCPQTAYRTQENPVAIDAALERSKMKMLQAAEKVAQRKYNKNVLSCQGLKGS